MSHIITKRTRAHTILFTEACPLRCRYCYLKTSQGYGTKPAFTKEKVLELVAKYDKEDNPEEVNTQLLFTGGEPFLYWDWIKEIIEKYQNRFYYEFNTSGYYFTDEILEFLSHYKVHFVLSLDGNEYLTNYLRPVYDSEYHTGYFKKIKQIIPTLLYYFPTTPYRIIVNPRYVDLLHQNYLWAEQLGFKYFTFILDFNCRPEHPIEGIKGWTEADTEILKQQMDLIVEEMAKGFYLNLSRPMCNEINKALKFLLSQQEFNVDNFPCQVFAGRTTTSVQNPELDDFCMASFYGTIEKAKQVMIDAYAQTDHHCSKDPDCPAFDFCALYCCPKNSLDEYNELFKFDTLECVVNKVCYQAALKLLDVCNQYCPDALGYKLFLNQFEYPGKGEAIFNGKISM